MKIKFKFFAFVLSMALTLPAFAQFTPATDTIAKPGLKQQDMVSKMGKPTFEATSGDLIFRIWIITQEDHKQMMAETKGNGTGMGMGNMNDKGKGTGMGKGNMNDKGNGMNKDMNMNGMKDMGMMKDTSAMKGKGMWMDSATKEAMMAGSHLIMVEVQNTVSGKETNAVSAKVDIVSPTNKNSSVDLKMPMENHFGSGLTLDEKGEYQFTVSVFTGNVTKSIKLKYTVK